MTPRRGGPGIADRGWTLRRYIATATMLSTMSYSHGQDSSHACAQRGLTYQRQDLEGIVNAHLRNFRQQSQHQARWMGHVGLERRLCEHYGVKRDRTCATRNRGTALIYLRPQRSIYPASRTPSLIITSDKGPRISIRQRTNHPPVYRPSPPALHPMSSLGSLLQPQPLIFHNSEHSETPTRGHSPQLSYVARIDRLLSLR